MEDKSAKQNEFEAAVSAVNAGEHEREAARAKDLTKAHEQETRVLLEQTKVNEQTGELTDETARNFIKQQLAAFAKFIARHGGRG